MGCKVGFFKSSVGIENKGFQTTPIPDHTHSSMISWMWSGIGVVGVGWVRVWVGWNGVGLGLDW